MTGQARQGKYTSLCSYCGKRMYQSRRDAKNAARAAFPGERFSAYRCHVNDDYWHFGHLAPEVRSGEVPRANFYGPRGVGVVRTMQGTRKPIVKKTRRDAA